MDRWRWWRERVGIESLAWFPEVVCLSLSHHLFARLERGNERRYVKCACGIEKGEWKSWSPLLSSCRYAVHSIYRVWLLSRSTSSSLLSFNPPFSSIAYYSSFSSWRILTYRISRRFGGENEILPQPLNLWLIWRFSLVEKQATDRENDHSPFPDLSYADYDIFVKWRNIKVCRCRLSLWIMKNSSK